MFPCFRYHKDKELSDKNLYQGAGEVKPEYGVKLFKSQAELEAAGDGWVDSPALLIEEIKEEPKQEPSASLDEELGKVKPKKGKK